MAIKNLLIAFGSQSRLALNRAVRASSSVSGLDSASLTCHSPTPTSALNQAASQAILRSQRPLNDGCPNQFTGILHGAKQMHHGARQMHLLSKRSFCSSSDDKQKALAVPEDKPSSDDKQKKTTLAEDNLAIHEALWIRFLIWVGGFLRLGSHYGRIFTIASAATLCFLERLHGQQVGSRGRVIFSDEDAILKMAAYAAPKTSEFSLGLFTGFFGLIWRFIKDLFKGLWLFGMFGALYATISEASWKKMRSVLRWFGLKIEEPVNRVEEIQKSLGVVRDSVKELFSLMDQMMGRMTKTEAKMEKIEAKMEYDRVVGEIRRRP